MCPVGGILTGASLTRPPELICHCLLIETTEGLVLVDTGLGHKNMGQPYRNFGAGFLLPFRPVLHPAETALYQLRAMGYDPRDVRHIVLTHLDVDHAGALSDFPEAEIHVYNAEFEAAMTPTNMIDSMRYPRNIFRHNPIWRRYATHGEAWFDFACVRQLRGLPPEFLLVPLTGHSHGHCAVAVDTEAGWLLHAGDAYFFHGEMQRRPACPPALEFFQTFVAVNRKQRIHNQSRLRQLIQEHREDVRVFCAHDPTELRRFQKATENATSTHYGPV